MNIGVFYSSICQKGLYKAKYKKYRENVILRLKQVGAAQYLNRRQGINTILLLKT